MKIKKLIKILECIEGDYKGKIPLDMYDLGSYTRGDDSRVGIDDMDFVHVMRSFKKMQGILAEEVRRDTQEGRVVSQDNQIFKLEQRVSQLLSRNVYLQERVDELTPQVAPPPKYQFCEIPNDCEGQEFIDNIKKYLNKKKYTLRVRGQHVKEEYKGTGATAYGQNINQSTHLRVYIQEV